MRPRDAVARLGGYATRTELLACGIDADFIALSVWYRNIIPVRRGHYVLPDLDAPLRRALAVGGPLACVSAIAWHEGREVPASEPIHVVVRYGTSRLHAEGAVVHWTRRVIEGGRTVVSEELARRQAASCRALSPRG